MNSVAEGGGGETLEFEDDVLRFHSFMATVAIGGYRKDILAVVTGPAGFAPFHLGHGHSFFLAGDNFSVVAASAGATGFGQVNGVTECGFTKSLDFVGYIPWLTFVTFYAVFFRCHAECLHAAMTGAARSGFFHFGHGKVLAVSDVKDGVVADFTIVVIFFQMKSMAEYNRLGILESEFDVPGFDSTGVNRCEHYNCTSEQQRKMFLHGTTPLD